MLYRENTVLACCFPLIVHKKMWTYVSMPAFFNFSKTKNTLPKTASHPEIISLSTEQGKKARNPEGLGAFLTQLCAKIVVSGRFIPMKHRRSKVCFLLLNLFNFLLKFVKQITVEKVSHGNIKSITKLFY